MSTRVLNSALLICIFFFLLLEGIFVLSVIAGKEDYKPVTTEKKIVWTESPSEALKYTIELTGNPFKIPEKYSKTKHNTPIPEFDFSLKAVSGVEGKYTAIFRNNKSGMSVSVTSGDIIGGWKVSSVTQERVILINEGFRKELSVW